MFEDRYERAVIEAIIFTIQMKTVGNYTAGLEQLECWFAELLEMRLTENGASVGLLLILHIWMIEREKPEMKS